MKNVDNLTNVSIFLLTANMYIAGNMRMRCAKCNEWFVYLFPGITDTDPYWFGYGPILSASTDLGIESPIKVAEKFVTCHGGFSCSLKQCQKCLSS